MIRKIRNKLLIIMVVIFIITTGLPSIKGLDYAKSSANGATYTNPVAHDIADLSVLTHDGKYYMYGTRVAGGSHGYEVYYSTNLVNWTKHNQLALNPDQNWGGGLHWAPSVARRDDGFFYMNYTLNQSLYIARSSSPLGPFTKHGNGKLLEGWYIDSHYFKDEDGKEYLYFNNALGIWVGEFNADLTGLHSITHCFGSQSHPESWVTQVVNEGPHMIKKDGIYYLFYSGNGWGSIYGVGYATSTSPKGPWVKSPHNPILFRTNQVQGVGHNGFAYSPDGSQLWMIYHSHYSLTQGEPRKANIDQMEFIPQSTGPDRVKVHGPTRTSQPMPSGAGVVLPKNQPGYFNNLRLGDYVRGEKISIIEAISGDIHQNNIPQNSYDGSIDTFWRNTDSIENAWIEYELGNIYEISDIKLMLTRNNLRTHQMKIKVDGVEVWSGNTELKTEQFKYQTFNVSPKLGSRISIRMTDKNSENNNVLGIRDIEIYGRIASIPVTVDTKWLDTAKVWEFNNDAEGWIGANHISGFKWQSGGYLGGNITGADPWILSPTDLGVNITGQNKLLIRLKNNTASNTAEIFWETPHGGFGVNRHITFPIVPNDNYYREYIIDMSSKAEWSGILNRLRIDPSTLITTGSFSIDYIKIGTLKHRNLYNSNSSSAIIVNAKASSVGSNNHPTNSYDGNPGTKFRTGSGDWIGERWIEFTLNDSYMINGVKLLFDDEWSPSTKIHPLRIEINGQVVWQGNSLPPKAEMQLFDLNSTIGDSIKIIMTSPATFLPTVEGESNAQQPNNLAISEFELIYESLEPEKAAEDMVVAYETIPITRLEEIAQAEMLEAQATALVVKLEDGDLKTQLEARITSRKAEINVIKEAIEAEIEISRQVVAEAAVVAYEVAPITTLAEVAEAETLGDEAQTLTALVQDIVVKASLGIRITTRNFQIDVSKAVLLEEAAEAQRQLEAEVAVVAYEDAPLTTLAEVVTAELLKETAAVKVDLIQNEEVKTAFEMRIAARKVEVDIAREELEGLAPLYGDVNGDGQVTNVDLILMKRYIAGIIVVDFDEEAADVNGDGKLTNVDLILLQRYIAGVINRLGP